MTSHQAKTGTAVSGTVRSVAAIAAVALALSACQTRLPNPLSRGAPTGPVQTSDLPPLPGPDGQPAQAFDPNAPAPALTQPGAQSGVQQNVQVATNQATGPQPFDPAAAAAAAPPVVVQQPAVIAQPSVQQPIQPAAPIAPAVQLSRADMLGAWQLASNADSCQLFMTLTTWTGGYRATTKGCTSVELANITAWDLSSNQVVLVGATGSQVASLVPAGGNRFSGQTKSGASIAVSR